MASSQRPNLERFMNQFRRELTDDQEKTISGANRTAINHEIQKMQAKLGRENSLCRLSRMERFLDAMEHIEKLVTIFLNVSEAVAFIWGPIKLVLMAAMAWTSCVRKLLDVYEEIADALDNLAFFHTLIRSDERFSRMLEDYFSDILRFHHCVLDFFSRPDWKGRFQWAWGDFRRKVKPTIESLKRKQTMLSNDKLHPQAILKEVQDSRLYARDQFTQLKSGVEGMITSEQMRHQQLEDKEIKSCLERKLNVSLPEIKSQLKLPDRRIGSSGSWIFAEDDYKSWETNMSPQGSVLFLTGCPGAGKSTLARTIIHHLNQKLCQQSSDRSLVTYFFFNHNDTDRRSTRSMLCHLITQTINTDDAMMRFAYDRCSSMDYLDLAVLKSLALDCFSSQRENIVILDGLDEAKGDEPERAVKWCLDQLVQTSSSRGFHVKLLICGQEDGTIDSILSPYPKIRLDTAKPHQKDIERHCKAQASVIGHRFRLSPDDEMALVLRVTRASNGMFLYTEVVLANLASMGSKKQFKAELASDHFPRNLDEAYTRIVQRVIDLAEPSARASAKKILGWVVCSQRPLRWREIQSRFCIDAEEGLCDPDDLRADSCKQLCSSLVDATDCETFPRIKAEQTITIIHETASKYLVHTGTIDLIQEHINMSLFSCRYLYSKPFLSIGSECINEAILSGYFGFMDYAAVYYRSHLDINESSEGVARMALNSASEADGAKEALSNLKKAYNIYGPEEIPGGSPSHQISKTLNLAIQDKVRAIRSIIDEQRDRFSQNAEFRDLEGLKRYKCPRILCSKFSVGFSSEAALQGHFASHERSFRCTHKTCSFHIVGFPSQKELQDHTKASHSDESRTSITFPAGRKTGKLDITDACKAGDLRKVKLLHLLGADLLGVSAEISPLKVALDAGHGDICRYLIDNGVNPFEAHLDSVPYEMSPMHLATHRKDFPMLELFLFGHLDLTTTRPRCARFVLDILTNYQPGVDLLLRLLGRSLFAGHETVRSVLVEQLGALFCNWGAEGGQFSGGFRHSNDATPLHKRFCRLFPNLYDRKNRFSPDLKCAEYAICQEALKGRSDLLHNAFSMKQYPLAAFLMDIDINNHLMVQNTLGHMPLHRFIYDCCRSGCNGCASTAQRLARIVGGRFANIPDHANKLPIHLAVEKLSPDMLETLLGYTIDLNHKDEEGKSALHYAESEESLSILSQHWQVDFLSRNRKGQTVFTAQCDVLYPSTKFLKALLKADIRLAWTADESAQSFTPLHYAIGLGGCRFSHSIVALLLQLPEVDRVLQAFLATGTTGSEEIRKIASEKKLEQALKAMDEVGFGLSPSH